MLTLAFVDLWGPSSASDYKVEFLLAHFSFISVNVLLISEPSLICGLAEENSTLCYLPIYYLCELTNVSMTGDVSWLTALSSLRLFSCLSPRLEEFVVQGFLVLLFELEEPTLGLAPLM